MHWNQIEYARNELVEVGAYPWLPPEIWLPGRIVGVCVRPDGETTYDVQTATVVISVSPNKIRRKSVT